MKIGRGLLAAAALGCAHPACAQEVFGGVYAHGVDTPLTLETGERGVSVQGGVRFAPIKGLGFIGQPEPYLLASISTAGNTSFAGGGLSWTLGHRFYARPGIGIVVHDGPSMRVDRATGLRTDLGSRVLFEPEFALGAQLDRRWSVEASWVHVSHARLFSGQNPGLDLIDIRLNYRLRWAAGVPSTRKRVTAVVFSSHSPPTRSHVSR